MLNRWLCVLMTPVLYRMTYPGDGYRTKESVTVLAMDVADGLDIAGKVRQFDHAVGKIEPASPRWMDSDSSVSPDGVSEQALRHWADKLGFDVIKKSDT